VLFKKKTLGQCFYTKKKKGTQRAFLKFLSFNHLLRKVFNKNKIEIALSPKFSGSNEGSKKKANKVVLLLEIKFL